MRIRRITSGHAGAFEAINVTPLIDVVMCLIVFFLIVGKLASERGMAVRLPQAVSGREENSARVLVVTIGRISADAERSAGFAAAGVIVQLDGKFMVDAKALEGQVFSRINEQPETSVQLRADRDLSFGLVEPVLRACRDAGAKNVRLATEKPS